MIQQSFITSMISYLVYNQSYVASAATLIVKSHGYGDRNGLFMLRKNKVSCYIRVAKFAQSMGDIQASFDIDSSRCQSGDSE
jgi:hypothetical protein